MIAIPARDEAAGVGEVLEALAAQVGEDGQPFREFSVLLLVNNCAGGTAARARAAAPTGLSLQVEEVTLSPSEANVVGARRRALDRAAELAGTEGVLVSTDADTHAAPDWLWALLAPILAGADAAAGRILLSGDGAGLDEESRCTHHLDDLYRLAACELSAHHNPDPADPWPCHWQHFGANLALSVRAYHAVGGVPQVPCLEDLALVRELRRADRTLRHTPDARVYTSTRLSGRVTVGLSTQLAEWRCGPDAWQVPGGAEIMALARADAALKSAYSGTWPPALAQLWRTQELPLRAALRAPTFGLALEAAHIARGNGDWAAVYPPVPVKQALAEVRGLMDWPAASGPDQVSWANTSSR
ncbi:glycosyltransferase [Deinococcus arenicola]|uniref:Glycosyltransferase n=1 Tax=Deinococcus arenicola TaxID=2994950 RepID=A0ABU4DX16_9DEIO|nr:glycosyltransferase [Deinococcus sp. ZS9-10]MDV6376219.1 glycosyltransferase [Deinococcus sp. ZS9-10]